LFARHHAISGFKKFQQAAEKVEEIKNEIQDSQARPGPRLNACLVLQMGMTYRDLYQKIETRHREHFHSAITSLLVGVNVLSHNAGGSVA